MSQSLFPSIDISQEIIGSFSDVGSVYGLSVIKRKYSPSHTRAQSWARATALQLVEVSLWTLHSAQTCPPFSSMPLSNKWWILCAVLLSCLVRFGSCRKGKTNKTKFVCVYACGFFFKLALVSSQLVVVAIRPCFRRKFSSRTSCVKYDCAQGLYIFTFLYLSLKFYSCWNTAWMCWALMRVIVYSSTVLYYIHIFVKIATKNILEITRKCSNVLNRNNCHFFYCLYFYFYLLFCLRSF